MTQPPHEALLWKGREPCGPLASRPTPGRSSASRARSAPRSRFPTVWASGIAGSPAAPSPGGGPSLREEGPGRRAWGAAPHRVVTCALPASLSVPRAPAQRGPVPFPRAASQAAGGELWRGRWSDRSARGCDLSPQSRCRAFSTRRCVTSWRNSATGAPASQPRAWGAERGPSRAAEESRPGVGKNM